jgi:hypothetical protein
MVEFVPSVFVGAVVGLKFQRTIANPTPPPEPLLHKSAYFPPIGGIQVGFVGFFIHRKILLSC